MKCICSILFSGKKNQKNIINLSSIELAQIVKVNKSVNKNTQVALYNRVHYSIVLDITQS